jgi:hypothetical protein
LALTLGAAAKLWAGLNIITDKKTNDSNKIPLLNRFILVLLSLDAKE